MVTKQKLERMSKNCQILPYLQNHAFYAVFGRFLKFLLSNHLKPNTEPYSTTQDSTLDTPRGGFWTTFFYPLQWGWETQKMLESQGV